MAEIRWHIIKKEGNPTKDGTYLTTKQFEWSNGKCSYYGTGELRFDGGWNCYRESDGTIYREHEIKDVYAWADIEHLYDEFPKRKGKRG